VASALKKSFEELFIIACNGIASLQQLRYLKEHGVDSYNHNLETSREYYPQICTTHGWEERYATCEAVKSAGLALCVGGIFGMGESSADRESLLRSIESLEPEAVPLNFYLPNPALPLKESDIDADEALEIVRKSRAFMGERGIVMVAGGRERLFAGREEELFEAGANSIVIGDYLTTKGREARSDLQLLASLGYEIATSCHE
jgi:biotin synthase